jgi:hypothetical protein
MHSFITKDDGGLVLKHPCLMQFGNQCRHIIMTFNEEDGGVVIWAAENSLYKLGERVDNCIGYYLFNGVIELKN